MAIKLKPTQSEEHKTVVNQMLKDGQFEQIFCRPRHIWREYRKVYGNPENMVHEQSSSDQLQDVIETVALMLMTFRRRPVFQILRKQDRRWFRGNGTLLLCRTLEKE